MSKIVRIAGSAVLVAGSVGAPALADVGVHDRSSEYVEACAVWGEPVDAAGTYVFARACGYDDGDRSGVNASRETYHCQEDDGALWCTYEGGEHYESVGRVTRTATSMTLTGSLHGVYGTTGTCAVDLRIDHDEFEGGSTPTAGTPYFFLFGSPFGANGHVSAGSLYGQAAVGLIGAWAGAGNYRGEYAPAQSEAGSVCGFAEVTGPADDAEAYRATDEFIGVRADPWF